MASSCLEPGGEDAGSGGGGGLVATGGAGGSTGGGGGSAGGGSGFDAGWDAGVAEDGGTDAGADAGVVDAGTAGESCDHPRVLTPTVVDGGFEITFRAEPFENDEAASCATDGGLEVFYQFVLTEPSQNVTVLVSPVPATTAVANVSIRTADCQNAVELGCVNRVAAQPATPFMRFVGQPGTYVLVVELESGPWVDVTLRSELVRPPPTNDDCANALPIQFTNGRGVASGYTHGATNSSVGPTCAASSVEEDVVFSYTLTQPQDVLIERLAGNPVIFVRRACDSTIPADELACSAYVSSETLLLMNQQPGTYFLWAEGRLSNVNVPITLLPPTLPPSNDRCTSPVALFADGGVHDVVRGTTWGALSSTALSCQPVGRRGDVFYSLHIEQPTRLELIARPLPWDAGTLRPGLELSRVSDCTADGGLQSDAGELGCTFGADRTAGTRLTGSNLSFGDYLVAVQGRASAGPFELEARLLPIAPEPPANDTCSSPVALALDAGHAEARGSTRGATDDHLGLVCSRSQGLPDVVYSFTTPATSSTDAGFSARVDIRSENSVELDSPSVYVNRLCEPTYTTQYACSSTGGLEAQSVALARGLSPSTTYFVFVEGNNVARQGPFVLSLDVHDTPSNDRCEGALPLSLNTSTPGTLVGAADDYSDSVVYSAPCTAWRGADTVYSFTAPQSGNFRALLEAQEGALIGLSVIDGACDGTGDCVAQSTTTADQTEAMTFSAVAGRTYFLIVDAARATLGGNNPAQQTLGSFVISISQ